MRLLLPDFKGPSLATSLSEEIWSPTRNLETAFTSAVAESRTLRSTWLKGSNA